MKIEVHVTAESLADLYLQLSAELRDLETACGVRPGVNEAWDPATLAADVQTQAAAMLGETPVEAPAAPEVDPPAAEKPKRTRKAKEAADPTPAAADPTPAAADPTWAAAATVVEPAGASDTEASTSAAAVPTSQGSGTTIARWTESDITVEMTREDVLNAAREWIAAHPEGKDRAAKLIKGMAASLGAGKVSDLPDSDMQAFIELMHGGA